MASLFQQVAAQHGVPVEQVAGALGRNRARIDAAVNLPFGLFYLFAASFASRLIWRKYPLGEHGWIPGTVMVLFVSVIMAGSSTMLGEMWSFLAETYRIGSDHMSYRAFRLWWTQHRPELFLGALIVFWLAAGIAVRRHERQSIQS